MIQETQLTRTSECNGKSGGQLDSRSDGKQLLIDKVETFALRIPFKRGIKSDASAWSDRNSPAADSLLVKVTTDQGLEGWGEAFGFRAVASAKLAVDELIAPICAGQDATRIAPLMLAVQKSLHVFGRNGPLMLGISAVDIALWDIAGKAANAPLCRLLGGGVSDLPCYASLVRYSDPSLVRANVRRAIDAGFHSLKLHEIDFAAIRAAREEAGPDIELMLRRQLCLDVVRSWSAGRTAQGISFEMA
jgi:L-alanine-DL-glutamate epimerase-like enolase superfamily enzyme